MERLKGGIGQFLGISDGRRPPPQALQIGAKLQGEAREALIAALAVNTPPIHLTLSGRFYQCISLCYLTLCISLCLTASSSGYQRSGA